MFSSQIQDILTKQTAPLFKEYQATYTLTSGSTYTYGADDVTSRAIDALQIRVSLMIKTVISHKKAWP